MLKSFYSRIGSAKKLKGPLVGSAWADRPGRLALGPNEVFTGSGYGGNDFNQGRVIVIDNFSALPVSLFAITSVTINISNHLDCLF